MPAMIATQQTAFDPNWYPDLGASNDATPDVKNLTNKTEYDGPYQVFIGDGTGLNIKHIGSLPFTFL